MINSHSVHDIKTIKNIALRMWGSKRWLRSVKTILLPLIVSTTALAGLGGCVTSDEVRDEGDCESVGQRFATELGNIPQNQGICISYRGQLNLYLRYRSHAGCFEGGLAAWDSSIATLREGVNNSCEGTNTGSTSGFVGAVSYSIRPNCSLAAGLVVNHRNQNTALNQAIVNCVNHGGIQSECRQYSYPFAQCAAIAFGSSPTRCAAFAAVGSSENATARAAVTRCNQHPDRYTHCEPSRSGCNIP